MKISPMFEFWWKIALAILGVVAAGKLYQPSFVSDALAKDITGITGGLLALLLAVNPFIATGLAVSMTAAGRVAGWALAAVLGLSLILGGVSEARAQPRFPIPLPASRLGGGGDPLQNLQQLPSKILQWVAADAGKDLDAAILLAKDQPNSVSQACWTPLRGFVARIQKLPPPDQLPKLHLAVDIEVLTELMQALQPDSPVIVGCAALANFQKISARNMVAGIVTGAIALTKFAPVVP